MMVKMEVEGDFCEYFFTLCSLLHSLVAFDEAIKTSGNHRETKKYVKYENKVELVESLGSCPRAIRN
jgi:hypothetical protein